MKKQYLGRFLKDEYDLVKGRKLAGVVMETDKRKKGSTGKGGSKCQIPDIRQLYRCLSTPTSYKTQASMAEEMAQWIKCLPHEGKDSTGDPKNSP